MRFIQTHSMGSDCTAPYDIVDYQAKTASEFVNEVLKEEPKEWGYIELHNNIHALDGIEYKRGKPLQEIPDAWQHKEVTKVIASGGWGRMDYRIYVKTTEREEEIEKAAKEYVEGEPDGLQKLIGMVGFEFGAKWADKTMIDKACEWISYNNKNGGCLFDGWEDNFRKAMEG